jgi:hypothetical protein
MCLTNRGLYDFAHEIKKITFFIHVMVQGECLWSTELKIIGSYVRTVICHESWLVRNTTTPYKL